MKLKDLTVVAAHQVTGFSLDLTFSLLQHFIPSLLPQFLHPLASPGAPGEELTMRAWCQTPYLL